MAQPIYVFLSYSSKDREFVRKLDATLSNQGVPVFLDERDIKVGDSVPSKIYEGISKATHLLYVISSHSVNSKWVQEELEVAKVRQLGGKEIAVLPIIIEDIEPPSSIAHIHYADLSKWKAPDSYMNGIVKILIGLGIEYSTPSRPEVRFFLENLQLYLAVLTGVSRFAGYVKGAKLSDYAFSSEDNLKGEIARITVKWDIDSVEGSKLVRNNELGKFISKLKDANIDTHSSIIGNLINAAEELFELMDYRSAGAHTSKKWKNYEIPTELERLAIRLALMLEELSADVISIALPRSH